MTKLLLVDGHALLYRAYHATSGTTMTTSEGEPTNATFGFATILLRALQAEQPSHAAVAFDLGKPTFRHESFPAYKAHRPPMDDALVVQVARIKELVEAFGFPIYQMPGFEADDVLGTLARQAAAEGVETLILTGDLDTLQLVGPHVRVLTPKRGPDDITLYDEEAVQRRYGLAPERVPDFKALVGDTSDNIPGVQGIGEKTASKLLAEYGTIENLFDHLPLVPERTRKLLDGRRDQALASKLLATIVTDVPVRLDLAKGRADAYDRDAVFRLFTQLEFRSLITRLRAADGAPHLPSVVSAAPAPVPEPVAAPSPQLSLFGAMLDLPGGERQHATLAARTAGGAVLPLLAEPAPT